MTRPTEDEYARQRRLAGYYRDLFEIDKRGQEVYEDLYRRFVRAPSTKDFSQEGMLRTFVQTHQREVIEHIVRMINLGNGVEDSQPTEE